VSDDASPGTALRHAVADAGVGRDVLGVSLTAADGLGEVSVDDGVASVIVDLPIPDGAARGHVAEGIRAAAGAVPGVDRVAIEWRARAADPGVRVDQIPDVKTIVAVASGKGGVGKSTVAVNLATALADTGAAVGLLDADVYGPNAPTMLGLSDSTPATTPDDDIVPREAHGVKAMSMGFIVDDDDPVIWRGPIVDDVLGQLFGDVLWGDLDYLVVDLPPGTGDTQLSLVQHLPVTGAVLVTTPESVSVDDTRRSVEQFGRYGVPILGVVENMRGFRCPDCDSLQDVFGGGGGEALAAEFRVPFLGALPLDPDVGLLEVEPPEPPGVSIPLLGDVRLPRTQEEREGGDRAPPVTLREAGGESRTAFRRLATRVAARVNRIVAGNDTETGATAGTPAMPDAEAGVEADGEPGSEAESGDDGDEE
jgi:ATP-binding protein involved in chromosome partitioning